MKPVTGSVGSSKPVSLPKAASILSSFASSQAGARQHAAAFLRLASASFDELVAFHGGFRPRRETPSSRDKEEARRRKKKSEEAASLGQKEGIFAEIEGNPGQSEPFPCGDPVGILGIGKSGRGEKRRKKKSEEAAFLVEKDVIFAGIEGILDIKDGKSDRREKKKKQPREEAAFLVDKDGSFAEVKRKPGQNERLLRRRLWGFLELSWGRSEQERRRRRGHIRREKADKAAVCPIWSRRGTTLQQRSEVEKEEEELRLNSCEKEEELRLNSCEKEEELRLNSYERSSRREW